MASGPFFKGVTQEESSKNTVTFSLRYVIGIVAALIVGLLVLAPVLSEYMPSFHFGSNTNSNTSTTMSGNIVPESVTLSNVDDVKYISGLYVKYGIRQDNGLITVYVWKDPSDQPYQLDIAYGATSYWQQPNLKFENNGSVVVSTQ